MSDLISRDALKKALKSNCKPDLCFYFGTTWCENCCRTNDFEYLIDNAPKVESDYELGYSEGFHDAERPQGVWLDDKVAFHFVCNQCGCAIRQDKSEVFEGNYNYNFCPNCGLKMI